MLDTCIPPWQRDWAPEVVPEKGEFNLTAIFVGLLSFLILKKKSLSDTSAYGPIPQYQWIEARPKQKQAKWVERVQKETERNC